MKRSDFKNGIRCIECRRPAADLHEIWGGRGIRQVCIKYNLQVPLCRECHNEAEKEKPFYSRHYFIKSKIPFDYDYIYRLVHDKRLRQKNQDKLEAIKSYTKKVMEKLAY